MTAPETPNQTPQAAQYSRDDTVASIRSFYTFLARLPRLSPSDILDAPPTGWEDISEETLGPLGKNATVIDLLRHIPYIHQNDEGNDIIAPKTRALRYGREHLKWVFETGHIQGILTPFGAGEIPPHVAVLTAGHKEGSWLLLDTDNGTVTDFIMFGTPERKTPELDSPDYWRAYHNKPVAAFFEEWKDNYLTTEWVIEPDDLMDGVRCQYPGIDEDTDEIREIYEKFGWPDNFRRDECREALHKKHFRHQEEMSEASDDSS